MLKTGILSSAYFDFDNYEEGIKKLREHGYDGVDYQGLGSFANSPIYKMTEGAAERYLTEVGECAKSNGVEIHQLHGIWPHVDDTTKEGREKTIEYFKRNIRDAKTLGCSKVVVHPCMPRLYFGEPFVEAEDFEINGYILESLAPVARECGVTVCLENMPFPKGSSFSHVEKIADLLSQINDDHIKACLDTGHFNTEKKDICEAIEKLGTHLSALHVHDDLHGQDRHLIPFQGQIDWDGFIRGLRNISYKGYISLETWIKEPTPEPMRTEMQKQLAKIAAYFAKEIDR